MCGFLGKRFPSRLGLRTEISARYRMQMNRTDGPHLFCFHENVRFGEKTLPFSVGKSNQFSVEKSNPFLLTHFTHYTYFTHFTDFMNQLAATWAQGPWAWGPAQGPGRGQPLSKVSIMSEAGKQKWVRILHRKNVRFVHRTWGFNCSPTLTF